MARSPSKKNPNRKMSKMSGKLAIQKIPAAIKAAAKKRLQKLGKYAAPRKGAAGRIANVDSVTRASVTSQRAARAQTPLRSGRGNKLSSEHIKKQKAIWNKKSRRSQLQHVKDHPTSSFPKRYGLKPR